MVTDVSSLWLPRRKLNAFIPFSLCLPKGDDVWVICQYRILIHILLRAYSDCWLKPETWNTRSYPEKEKQKKQEQVFPLY